MIFEKKLDLEHDEITLDDIKFITSNLLDSGINNIIVSLGYRGAMMRTKNGLFEAKPPKLSIKSTIGAGDATIAGFIYGTINNYNDLELLKTSVAFGSAKCLSSGTLPPKKEDFLKIKEDVIVKELI